MTESSLYPGSYQIPVMKYCAKISEAQAEKAWSSGEWVAQEKKDGGLYMLEKTAEGNLYLFSRTTSKKTGELAEKLDNFPQIRSFGEYLPNGTILIGEVYVPGGKSNTVTKLSGCLPAKAIKRQFNEKEADEFVGPAHYYIFDIIRYNEKDLIERPTIERLEFLNKIELIVQEIGDNSLIEIAQTYTDNFEILLKSIFAAGGEGVVFKHKNCPYRPGKRTTISQMFKWKEHLDSIDLVCMELLDPVKEYTGKELETWPYWIIEHDIHFGSINGNSWAPNYQSDFRWYKNCPVGEPEKIKNPGYRTVPVTKPYYYGWKNAMRLGAYRDGELVEVCRVASGLTDEMREDMAINPNNYLGKVIEIECMSVDKNAGTVRHPVFKSVREDKPSQDCQWREIFS